MKMWLKILSAVLVIVIAATAILLFTKEENGYHLFHTQFSLIFVGQLVHFVQTEHRAVLTYILVADIATAALTQSALHL